MNEFNITVEGGSSVRLPTAGKYVDRDIIVTSTGGVEDLNTQLTEQETLITELKEILKGKANGGGVVTCNSVTPSSANTISDMASGLSISYPKANRVQERAFYKCSALTSVDLPKATSISEGAFDGCTSFDTLILGNTETVCNLDLTAILNTKIATEYGEPTGEGFIYVPTAFYEQYLATLTEQAYMLLVYSGYSEEEAEYMAPYIIMAILRTIEDTEQASTFGLRNPLANFKGFTKEAIERFVQRNKTLDNELGG